MSTCCRNTDTSDISADPQLCACAAQAKCSCGAKPALSCTCEKAPVENTLPKETCSCHKRPKGACTCERAPVENKCGCGEKGVTECDCEGTKAKAAAKTPGTASAAGLREGEVDYTTKKK
ncbi:copper resistance protein Crd2 [Peziza echinospora]|nr:copper resistance protein Crd2 [Peziza echinospora]